MENQPQHLSSSSSIVAHAHSPRKIAGLLALASMTGPFGVDMYLPAFHAMERGLEASALQMQQTLTLFFVGMALMSLFHGAISDFVGRKPVVMIALSIYALASVGCALSTDIHVLMVFRLLQGLTSTAGFLVGRALVRDLFEGPQAQKLQSQQTLIFGLAPIVAPILGGFIITYGPWQAIFWTLTGLTLLAIILLYRYLPESLPVERRHTLSFGRLMSNYFQVFKRPEFQVIAFGNAFVHAGVMLYVLTAPVMVLQHLELGEQGFYWVFVPSMGGIMLGAFLSGRLAGRVRPEVQAMLGMAICMLGALANILVNRLYTPQVPSHVIPIAIFSCGMGLALPPFQLKLMDYFPDVRGACTSMLGFTQMTFTSFTSALIVPLVSGTSLRIAAMQATLFVIGAAAFLFYIIQYNWHTPDSALTQKHPDPP
jgi:MFS transporter, DHA1 family, multidrug resistance protein